MEDESGMLEESSSRSFCVLNTKLFLRRRLCCGVEISLLVVSQPADENARRMEGEGKEEKGKLDFIMPSFLEMPVRWWRTARDKHKHKREERC